MGTVIEGWGEEEFTLSAWDSQETMWHGRRVGSGDGEQIASARLQKVAIAAFSKMGGGPFLKEGRSFRPLALSREAFNWSILSEEERMGKLLVPDPPPRIETWEEPATSKKFVIEGREEPGVRIGMINGISNNLVSAKKSAEMVSSLAGGYRIELVYNKSHWAFDSFELILNYFGYSPVVHNLLLENWTRFHREYIDDDTAVYIQVCHSQGAIHVRNALLSAPDEVRRRLMIILVAPAVMISEIDNCQGIERFSCRWDLVPRVQLIARILTDINYLSYSERTEKVVEAYQRINWSDPGSLTMGHDFDTTVLQRDLEMAIKRTMSEHMRLTRQWYFEYDDD